MNKTRKNSPDQWEDVAWTVTEGAAPTRHVSLRRIAVPGGWLYQPAASSAIATPPVTFVPDPNAGKPERALEVTLDLSHSDDGFMRLARNAIERYIKGTYPGIYYTIKDIK